MMASFSLVLLAVCHGAQAEVQIPNPYVGQSMSGKIKNPSHRERFLRRPYCCQWPHPWTTVSRSGLVGGAYALS